MIPTADVVAKINALPEGSFFGTAGTKNYVVTCTRFCAARATKLVAEERGGNDYISLNLYELQSGPRLYPCEMAAAKVITFVKALEVTRVTPAPA